MKQYLQFTQRCLLFATSLLVSSVVATSPSRAATFASSQGILVLDNFSQSPDSTFTDANSSATSISNGGAVDTRAEARGFLTVDPPAGFNITVSTANGRDGNYIGIAESDAKFIGIFDIAADTLFSFDFTGFFQLSTSIDNPVVENATASGDMYFALLDVTNKSILESFYLAGNVTNNDDHNFLNYQKTDNITLNTIPITSNFVGQTKFALANDFKGSVQRYFPNKTTLSVVAINGNRATVSVPEPSTSIALIFGFGVILIAEKHQRQLRRNLSITKKLPAKFELI